MDEEDEDVSMPLSQCSEPELLELVSSDPSLIDGLKDGKHPELFVEVDELSDAILPLSHLACSLPGVSRNERTVTVKFESSRLDNNDPNFRLRLVSGLAPSIFIFCRSFGANVSLA